MTSLRHGCPPRATELVGRDAETDMLSRALDAARSGHGSAVFILGEAGIGKSRLAREAEHEARRRGMIVLRGRAVQTDTPVPFRPIAEALLSHLRTTGLPDVAEIAPFRPILGRLVPEWRDARQPTTDASTVALAEGVLRLLRVVAGDDGCLLVLDDLHWADPETLAIVEYLADNLHTEPVLGVGTLRSEERSQALDRVRSLAARRVADLLELSRLSDDDVMRLARSCLGAAVPEAALSFLQSAGEGIPFLIEELLASAVGGGVLVPDGGQWVVKGSLEPSVPATVRATVGQRLRLLGDLARPIKAAAVLGRHFDWTLLASMVGTDEETILDALHAAVDLQIVVADEGDFRFRHALTRDAVLGELLPPQAAALARRALTALRATGAALSTDECELAAGLAELAGDREQAATLLLEAGRRALTGGALGSAEATLERARRLEVTDPLIQADILEVLTEVLSLAGKTDRVAETGEALLTHLDTLGASQWRRARTHLLLARAAITSSRWAVATDHLEQARRLGLEPDQPGALLPPVDALAAQVAMGDGEVDRAAALARAALAGAERANLPEVACEALEVIGRCARLRDLEQAEAAFDRARRLAEEHGLTLWRIRALHELGTIDLLNAAPVDRLVQARELAIQAGALATAAVVDLQIGAGLLSRFELQGAIEALQRSAELARRFHLASLLGMDLVLLAGAFGYRAQGDQMKAAISEALRVAGESPDVAASVWGEYGTISLLAENRKRARRELDRAMEIVQRSATTSPHPFRGLWALVQAVEGSGEDACVVVRESGATVQRANNGFLSYAEALLLGRAGRRTEATAAASRGDTALAPLPLYFHLARRLAAEGAIECGWGHPVTWLHEAMVFFDEHGYHRPVSACRSLLRRAGVPVPRRGRGEAEVPGELRVLGVTSREMDVLLLLAEGLSNREIAGRLYISPRTVERHVESLLARTGLETRARLVAFAARVTATAEPF